MSAALNYTLKEYIMTAITEKSSEQEIIAAIAELAPKLPEGHKFRNIPKRFANKLVARARFEEVAKLVAEGATTAVGAVAEEGTTLAKKVKEKVAKSKASAEKVSNGGGSYKVLKKKGAEGLTVRESSERGKVLAAMWASKAAQTVEEIAKAAGLEAGKVKSALAYLVVREIVASTAKA